MKQILPSLLAANFATIGQTLQTLNPHFDYLHFDVMDGDFVPPITFGSQMISSLRPLSQAQFDVHLMTYRVEQHIPLIAKAGANLISFHLEAVVHAHRIVKQIKELGCKAGIALVPSSPVELLKPLLSSLDYILVMSVDPGYGGQPFIEESWHKIEQLATLREQHHYHYLIEVDGGIHLANAPILFQKGADLLVIGSNLINDKLESNIVQFKELSR